MIRTVWDALSKVNRLHPPQRDDAGADDLKSLNLVKVKTRDELDALRYSVLKVRNHTKKFFFFSFGLY